jgi:hypothetical protein
MIADIALCIAALVLAVACAWANLTVVKIRQERRNG